MIGIDYNYMIGQGYDEVASMSGMFHGAHVYVQEKCPLATYVHSASHSLNLSISDACNIASIRNCLGSIELIYNFFNSPKRQNILTTSIQNVVATSFHSKLKQLCPTRWIQRHDSVITYLELQDAVIDASEKISTWTDKNTSSLANQLQFVINNFEFQITIHIVSTVFAVSLPLSKHLQTIEFDLFHVINMADNSINVLKKMRKNVEKEFKIIFKKVEMFCKNFNISMTLPRRVSKQVDRDNTPVTTLEEYY